MANNDSIFSKNLRKLIKERGLTLEKVARLSGTNTTQIYRWTSGLAPRGYITAFKLANLFQVDFQWLLTGEESGNSPHLIPEGLYRITPCHKGIVNSFNIEKTWRKLRMRKWKIQDRLEKFFYQNGKSLGLTEALDFIADNFLRITKIDYDNKTLLVKKSCEVNYGNENKMSELRNGKL